MKRVHRIPCMEHDLWLQRRKPLQCIVIPAWRETSDRMVSKMALKIEPWLPTFFHTVVPPWNTCCSIFWHIPKFKFVHVEFTFLVGTSTANPIVLWTFPSTQSSEYREFSYFPIFLLMSLLIWLGWRENLQNTPKFDSTNNGFLSMFP